MKHALALILLTALTLPSVASASAPTGPQVNHAFAQLGQISKQSHKCDVPAGVTARAACYNRLGWRSYAAVAVLRAAVQARYGDCKASDVVNLYASRVLADAIVGKAHPRSVSTAAALQSDWLGLMNGLAATRDCQG